MKRRRLVVASFFTLTLFSIVATGVVFGQQSSCWTDRPYYNVGDTITVYVQLGMSNPYYLYIFNSDGSNYVINLGNGGGSFSVPLTATSPGPSRIELWMSTIEIFGGSMNTMNPQYVTTCATVMVTPEFPFVPAVFLVAVLVANLMLRRRNGSSLIRKSGLT